MKIQISDYNDYKLYTAKVVDNDVYCEQCGLELNESEKFGLCADCFREAMQAAPENEPAHPSEWEDA